MFLHHHHIDLELAILRLTVSNNKLSENCSSTRIAARSSTERNTTRRRRLQCEILVRDERRIEAHELLILLCEVLVERIPLINSSSKRTKCPVELKGIVSTILFGLEGCLDSDTNAQETAVRRQLQAKYGKKFVQSALDNEDGVVDSRIVTNLSWQPPSEKEVQACWEQLELEREAVAEKQKETNRLAKKTNTTQAISSIKPPLKPETQNEAPELTDEDSKHFTQSSFSPTLPYRMFRPNPYLEICFDVRTKNPVYVLERLDRQAVESANARTAFFEELSLPRDYRSCLSHYKHSGYHRGHLAPAADFPPSTVQDSFTLCNVSPQDPSMNTSIMKKLEIWCRSVARGCRRTLIVTGPLWLPERNGDTYEYRCPAIGGNMSAVAVPTHFFKAVAVMKADDELLERVACFVIPNAKPTRTELEDYKISWSELETLSGMRFFAGT